MCPNCQRAYPSKSHLLTHLRQLHQIEMSSEEFEQLSQESGQEEATTESNEQIETDEVNLVYAIEEITNDR